MTSFHTAFASGALIINYMNNFTLCTFTPVKMTEYKAVSYTHLTLPTICSV